MQMLKRLIVTAILATTPVAGTAFAAPAAPAAPAATDATAAAAAPATAPVAAPVEQPAAAASTAATAAATPAAAATSAAPAFEYARPVAGIGQPTSGGMDFQPQATANGEFAHWFNNGILLPLCVAISLLVLGLMLWIVARYRAGANPVPSKTSHNTVIEVLWTLVPVLILVAVAVPSIDLLARQYAPPPKDAITIKVTGYQWYWGYAYPDHEISEYVSNILDRPTAEARGEPYHLAVDNRVVVPVGKTVKLIITAADVIHSFSVPSMWVKMDAVPGRLNEVSFTPLHTGVYYGQCSELCGINHGYMPIAVEVVSEERFAQWVASRGGKMPSAAAAPAAPGAAAATPAPAASAATSAAAPAASAATSAAAATSPAATDAPAAAPAAAPAH